MGILQGAYYKKIIGSISTGFANLVIIGERNENGMFMLFLSLSYNHMLLDIILVAISQVSVGFVRTGISNNLVD